LFFLTLIALFLVAVSAVIDALKSRFLQELAWQVDLQLRERSFLGAYRRGLVSRRFGRTSSRPTSRLSKGSWRARAVGVAGSALDARVPDRPSAAVAVAGGLGARYSRSWC
jgi:hypothetical protein